MLDKKELWFSTIKDEMRTSCERTLQAAAVKKGGRDLLGGRDQAPNPRIYAGHVMARVTGHVAVLL